MGVWPALTLSPGRTRGSALPAGRSTSVREPKCISPILCPVLTLSPTSIQDEILRATIPAICTTIARPLGPSMAIRFWWCSSSRPRPRVSKARAPPRSPLRSRRPQRTRRPAPVPGAAPGPGRTRESPLRPQGRRDRSAAGRPAEAWRQRRAAATRTGELFSSFSPLSSSLASLLRKSRATGEKERGRDVYERDTPPNRAEMALQLLLREGRVLDRDHHPVRGQDLSDLLEHVPLDLLWQGRKG